MRSISILGATGSVGASTLDLIRREPDQWRVVALTANCQSQELAALAREFDAEIAVVADDSCRAELRAALSGTGVGGCGGRAGFVRGCRAGRGSDGCGDRRLRRAGADHGRDRQGGTIALANKEALVSAGEVMMAAVG